MTRDTRRIYDRFRQRGYGAKESLRSARILARFNRLADAGYVRIAAEPDNDHDDSWLDQDCFDDRYRKSVRQMIRNDGVWGSIGQYTLAPFATFPKWEDADSVWGHIGYSNTLDPLENPYLVQIAEETLSQLHAAHDRQRQERRDVAAGRCPCCHGSGRHVA